MEVVFAGDEVVWELSATTPSITRVELEVKGTTKFLFGGSTKAIHSQTLLSGKTQIRSMAPPVSEGELGRYEYLVRGVRGKRKRQITLDPVIIAGLSPRKGCRPVSISYSIVPNAKMSERASSVFAIACSGDMYATVPSIRPSRVNSSESVSVWASDEAAAGTTGFAKPKSTILTCPSRVTMTLPGLVVPSSPRQLLPEIDGHAHARSPRRVAVADESAAGVERRLPVEARVAGEHVVGPFAALCEAERFAGQDPRDREAVVGLEDADLVDRDPGHLHRLFRRAPRRL